MLSLSVKSSVVCSIHMLIRAQPESLFQTLLLNSEQFICLLLRVYLQHVQNGSSLTSPNLYPYIQSLSDDTGHISLGFLSQKAESSASSFLSILKFPMDSAASLPVLHLYPLYSFQPPTSSELLEHFCFTLLSEFASWLSLS